VRANIDDELVNKSSISCGVRKPPECLFFLYLPFSMGHFPNLPSQQFQGQITDGNYGDKLMEGITTSARSSTR